MKVGGMCWTIRTGASSITPLSLATTALSACGPPVDDADQQNARRHRRERTQLDDALIGQARMLGAGTSPSSRVDRRATAARRRGRQAAPRRGAHRRLLAARAERADLVDQLAAEGRPRW